MQQVEAEAARPQPPQEPPVATPPPTPGAGGFARLDNLEVESLMINLDNSLRVHAPHHFFNWTQGSLQSLIKHELLICALRLGKPIPSRFESYTSIPLDLAKFNEMLDRDSAWMPHLIGAWEQNYRKPVVCDAREQGSLITGALARELQKLNATHVIGHGTHDADGKPASFFLFACRTDVPVAREAYLVELAVPFLHAAWVRVQAGWSVSGGGAQPDSTSLLTPREVEILKWLYHGKSNVEIGLILGISPLTVKNHVQKILRKLDVLNRTQAVGKALALRILNI